MKYLRAVVSAVFVLSLACGVEGAAYTVSWVGNSFPGGTKWVQQDIEDICVAEDGTVYSVVSWDEAGAEVTAYRDGDVIVVAGHTHGWGYHGGSAIAANDEYVFFAQQVENEGGHLVDSQTWPPKGCQWYGVARRHRDDIAKAASFPGGKGGKGDTLRGGFLPIHELPDGTAGAISGLWATDTRLYISCPHDDRIRVYDAQSMAPVSSWPMERPGRMCMDSRQRLWIVQKGASDKPACILCFSADGELQSQRIDLPPGVVPLDLCIDAHGDASAEDELLVTDVGPAQQVYGYDGLDAQPRRRRAFGVPHGIYSAPAGVFRDLCFNHPVGVGVDAHGNVYIANSASSAREAGGGGGSTVLESYTRDARLNWRLFGLEFIDCADLDPAEGSPLHVYTKEEHFLVDPVAAGDRSWTLRGYTVDKFRYPYDPRLHIWSAGAWVRRIDGRPFLFVNDMNGEYLQVYRLPFHSDEEIAVPAGFFAKSHVRIEGWPPHQPSRGEWIWRDKDGDGAFDANEYEDAGGRDAPSLQGWWVDRSGNVWQATETEGIRKFPVQGLDERGNPIWSYSTMVVFDMPDEFDRIKRLRYDPQTDTMYLGGTTKEHKNQHWKPMGPVICRYDNWSGPDRRLRWKAVARYEIGSSGHESCEPMGFDVAGDFVFVPYTGRSKELRFAMGHIEIFDARTGDRIDSMEPDPKIGEIGLQDIRECLTAHRLAGGDYLVFLEDDWKAKVLMYRWRPN